MSPSQVAVLQVLAGIICTVYGNVVNVAKPIPASSLKLKSCPTDYRRRVETCIMDAQVAPQAGGGLTLVIRNDTIVNLCDRGLLRKTIDCLEEIHSRCLGNSTVMAELDRLYSVENWVEGERVLCEDTNLFLDNYSCMEKSANSVMACVLMATQTFRVGLYFTRQEDNLGVREVTCNFAENIVKCVRGPLLDNCPIQIVKSIGGAMHLFLPPFCMTDNFITVTQHPVPTATDEFKDVNVTSDAMKSSDETGPP